MPRTPRLPAGLLRPPLPPPSQKKGRPPASTRKPEDQPGKLWDKFRSEPGD